VQSDRYRHILEQYWGYQDFRGIQREIIESIGSGKDTLGLMPTGGGKSITFQVPALAQKGVCIVITPLIALMKDQVRHLREKGIIASAIHTGMSRSEIVKTLENCILGDVKFLYVSPERIASSIFQIKLKRIKVSFITVDEAHCISQWGYDFRPSYLRIADIRKIVPDVPVLALTATATPKVIDDIQDQLEFKARNVFRMSFERKNLTYVVREATDKEAELVHILSTVPGTAIVYVRSRRRCKDIATMLNAQGLPATFYHAGLESTVKDERQKLWQDDKVRIIVATNAFGMGIDKPDVRFVIHYDIPKSLEGYYQETGRSGRDGGEGLCITFYSNKDLQKLDKFMEGKPVAEQDIGRQLLQETAAYAETSVCRRKMLLHYFGEIYEKDNCSNCDNCLHPKKKVEAKQWLVVVLSAIAAIKENFRSDYVIDFVMGKETNEIVAHKHQELEEFGSGDDEDEKIWNPVIRQALIAGYLKKDVENYGLLKITAEGKKFLKKPKSFMIVEDKEFSEDEENEMVHEGGTCALDPALYSMLKDLRKKVSKKMERPPYVIFQDVSLEQMATDYPVTLEELKNIQGVGEGKIKQPYAKEFVDLIKRYCEENDIVRQADLRVRTVAKKSMLKVKIIQSIDRQIALDDIANAQGIDFEDLLDEVEAIVYSGTKLNIDYFLEDVMDEDHIDDIYDYFSESDTDELETAIAELGEDYSEDEIRLVRIKFISEMAN